MNRPTVGEKATEYRCSRCWGENNGYCVRILHPAVQTPPSEICPANSGVFPIWNRVTK